MAVLPMLRVNIYGLLKDRKKILEALQRRGVVDIKKAPLSSEKLSSPDTMGAVSTFLKASSVFEQALSILEDISPESKSAFESLKGKKDLSLENYYVFASETDSITAEANKTLSLYKGISEKKAEITRLNIQIESLLPWNTLDIPLSFKGTSKVSVLAGTFPEKKTLEEIIKAYDNALEKSGKDKEKERLFTDIEIISTDENQTACVIFCERASEDAVKSALRETGFANPMITTDNIPSLLIEETKEKIKSLEIEIRDAEKELKTLVGMRNAFKFMIDYYSMRIEKYQALSSLNQTEKTFMLTGYVPEKSAKDLEAEFTRRYNAAVELFIPEKDEEVPVLLKNNAFSSPCEGILETFSLPKKGELDPTFAMSLFYYVLFGLMLSDLAYGLIMVLGCGFALWKFKNMEESLKKTLKMYLYCGISTAFWGAMFGGFFGDAITVISSTYFGKEISFRPLWFEPIKDPMKMLVFSFAFGIVHLFAGLFMKLITCIKNRQYKDALYDVIFWYLLVGGAICYLLTLDMFLDMTGLKFKLPPIVSKVSVWAVIIGAVGIVLTAGRSSKNIFKRLAKGAYELYGVTGYLSDILSYSRLLALGLATGVIAQVFNKMGSMLGSGILGFILFMIVFIVGHTLNIGINLLGAYVHTNRLQFVEFFGKFYEGGGEKYSPFKTNTKYYKIREDV